MNEDKNKLEENILDKITKMIEYEFKLVRTEIEAVKVDVRYIRKEVEGNGQKGLLKRMTSVEKFQNLSTGGFVVVNIVVVPILLWMVFYLFTT